MVSLLVGPHYVLFTRVSLDTGLGFNIAAIFQIPLKCQGPLQIHPLERKKQTYSVTFFLKMRTGCGSRVNHI